MDSNELETGISRIGIGTGLNGHIVPSSMENNSVSINPGTGSVIMGSNPISPKYFCPSCGMKFCSAKELNFHKKETGHGWTCKYCGKIFTSRRKCQLHGESCKEKASLPKDSLGRVNSNVMCDRHAAAVKAAETVKAKNGGVYKNHPQSAESRAKCAASMQAYLKSIGKFCKANFNPKACEYIDQLNKLKGWNLIHALNGGEHAIGPYFVDGFDEKQNIVFEYDEHGHNKPKAKEHDLKRQEWIISQIHCEFWRYDEDTDTLYKVN